MFREASFEVSCFTAKEKMPHTTGETLTLPAIKGKNGCDNTQKATEQQTEFLHQ